MKLEWNGKTLKHVESGVEAESVEELMCNKKFFGWVWYNLLDVRYPISEVVKAYHAESGFAVECWGIQVWDKFRSSELFTEWLKNQVIPACEWKAERTNDGWVNVTHEPTGMSISSMFDVRDCVETITGSKKYVDWVCDQVEFEGDDLCILWVSGWYLHVPTGKTGETLEGLMINIYTYLCGSKEFVQEGGCVRHKGTGITVGGYGLMELITSDAFLKYLEGRING